MGADFFRFKQFIVWHNQCAMKVGTDGVLLGAWCPLPPSKDKPLRVLDIGTGSGLLALMIAQRLHERNDVFSICGIDIDSNAVEQSQKNFQQSPWAEHLMSVKCSLQDFQANLFDLIISNPPYFKNSLKNPDIARATARHTDTLSYQELIGHSSCLLAPNGVLALVLPIESMPEIKKQAKEYNMVPTHITYVHTKPGKEAKRILIALTRKNEEEVLKQISDFYIESDTSPRSEEYQALTREFYL